MTTTPLGRLQPMWTLTDGYPLGAAIELEQRQADTLQQTRYITDLSGNVHQIDPNPNSPYAGMASRPKDTHE